ncbi:DNA damage-regulated autophagy modulator protein 1-like [Apostichopus japonicus]|uniref:DNA damage-regulated autophagy modulator protein 1-like n=1 Tax=Stichopus japonicus TaxID=307972 RepID=UPI003AB646B7
MALGLAWLPIITTVVLCIALFATYGIGVAFGHVHYLFPYISDAGAEYPENSLFSFLFDVAALLILLNVYAQYLMHGTYFKHITHQNGGGGGALTVKSLPIVNKLSLIVAVIASCGMAIVANFPVDEKILVHLLGAFLLFTSSLIYCFLQSWVSYRLSPEIVPPCLSLFRLLLSVFSAAAYVILIICGTVLRWDATKENPMLRYRRISAGCEWFLAFAVIIFFLTYIHEFRNVNVTPRLLFWNTDSQTWDPEVTNDLVERLNDLSRKNKRSDSSRDWPLGHFSKKGRCQPATTDDVV